MASMDALGAFSHLTNNLPLWINRVSELTTHTAAKHTEYTEAFRRHAAFKPRRRKNSSVCSIHTEDLIPIAQRKSPNPEAVDQATRDARQPAQRSGRKRGPDEAPSIDSSDRHAFVSTRHNVIIEYDGHTQKVLEEIVRDIGIARNHMRRGKMSTMPRTGLRSGLLSKSANLNMKLGVKQDEASPLSCVRSTRTGPGVVGVTGTTGARKESSFDFTDKQLELAHGLCETAAYQVLRSGDCGTELDGVEEKLKIVLDIANNEVERLKAEKQQQQEQQQHEATKQPTEETPAKPPPTPTAARLARVAAIANKPSTAATGTIEVDDTSSISAESIDLSAFRSSRIRV
ncbi:hypothetical protein NUU61_006793 [Penicillium alfredii]|uniref:Uncharacterized protein n=1 Tax=Penicillium alfredii TaxID=1506179 RepID=A0A9W9F1K6_9EURO|nr:uncharacterized protein NUU61_006793 [Penicillium alfredii]KAJ5091923.1 hypothetical protein NUU61_006793 [Penicillium alfredii]